MKAVIQVGDKQQIVAEKETLLVDKLPEDQKELTFDALLTFDEKSTEVGTPTVKDVKVKAKVIEDLVKGDKVLAIRYKAKKRVNKVHGHRQQYSRIEIVSIK
jgi:large subunit ribosomal protein L21